MRFGGGIKPFMRLIAILAAIVAFRQCVASTYTATIASDSQNIIDPSETVAGTTGWYDGYRRVTVGGEIVREFVGWDTYTWNRTNSDTVSYQGYTVTITAIDFPEDSGLVSQFTNPATVNWGPEVIPEQGGGGGH